MKLFEILLTKIGRLKAIRITKTLITLAIITALGLIIFVATLPISVGQKIIVLVLSGLLSLLTMLADDHASKDSYLDELRDVADKLDQG